jgi:hypothetical protein
MKAKLKRKSFLVDEADLRRARQALGTETDADTIRGALRQVARMGALWRFTQHSRRRLAPGSWGLTVVLAMVCASGCGGDGSVTHTFKNEGFLCLYPAAETTSAPATFDRSVRTYAADQPVNVAVQFNACLSSSCSKKPMATCSIDASGGTLQVTSDGSFVDPASNIGCTGDCRFLIARCTTASLPAGSYTFKHGTDTLALTVPSSGPPPCVGGPMP